jgi:putative two-component system response regulator
MTRALLVEPDPMTRDLIAATLAACGYEVSHASTLAGARRHLEADRYDAVLSAMALPDGSGTLLAEAARELQPHIATLIIAENGDFDTARQILGGGVDGYLVRPLNTEQLAVTMAGALQRRVERQAAQRHGDELRALVAAQTSASDDPAFGELLLRRLVRTARFRDEETAAHMQRMSESCAAIARRLGFSDADCERLRAAALLHDIGKVGVPDAVLRKAGKLTHDERRLIEFHPEYGHEILSGSGNDLVELAATVALSHHERPDGRGYPRGLKGEEIPLVGRIAAVADVFDALTNDRVYRRAYSLEDATAMMTEGRGTQFDAQVMDAFLDAIEEITQIQKRLPDAPAEPTVPATTESGPRPTRVLIVEDHEAVGRGLELLLRREGMEIAGTAFDLAGARGLIERRRPDVVVLDVDLGGESGLDLLEDAHRAGARVLLYTGRADPTVLAAASQSEAAGVATKAGPPVDLIAAVRAVAAGETYRDPRLMPKARVAGGQLTQREREVITLLAQGLNGEEVAETLFLSPATIRTHLRNAMDKVGARTRAHLIAVALAADEIDLDI